MKSLLIAAMMLFALMAVPTPAFDRIPDEYSGSHAKNNVLVGVEFFDGWNSVLSAALDCAGRLRIVGVYWDTTAIEAVVAPDTAMAMIDELVALAFMSLQPVFRNIEPRLAEAEDGSVSFRVSEWCDAGSAKITLVLGPHRHEVALLTPATGASEALKAWVRRFRDLMDSRIPK